MKYRIFLIALIMGLLIVPNLQSAPKYSNSLSANPIGLVFGVLNATYEWQTTPENSFTIFGSYWTLSDWSAWGFGASYRWYIVPQTGKKIIEGFSFGPRAELSYWDYLSTWYNYSGGLGISIGGEASYKWVFGGFVVEPQITLMINVVKVSGLSYPGFGTGVNLGYAW